VNNVRTLPIYDEEQRIVYNYLKYIKLSFDDAKLHEKVDELQEEITYIAGIVRNLLSLAGTAQAEREEIDINEMIRSTMSVRNLDQAGCRFTILLPLSSSRIRVE
jgi:nitrogen fixation/metabolism regulation signal transduction histidine kinase